jgi:acyl dehydratase
MSGAGPAYERVAIGDALPPFSLVITLQRLVMEAGVNRDFSPWHFDAQTARESGAEAAFANTTFVESLLEFGLRAWAGPGPRIRMLEYAMRRPSVVGDDVTVTGVVTGKDDAARTVALDVWLESARGRGVQGSAVLQF